MNLVVPTSGHANGDLLNDIELFKLIQEDVDEDLAPDSSLASESVIPKQRGHLKPVPEEPSQSKTDLSVS